MVSVLQSNESDSFPEKELYDTSGTVVNSAFKIKRGLVLAGVNTDSLGSDSYEKVVALEEYQNLYPAARIHALQYTDGSSYVDIPSDIYFNPTEAGERYVDAARTPFNYKVDDTIDVYDDSTLGPASTIADYENNTAVKNTYDVLYYDTSKKILETDAAGEVTEIIGQAPTAPAAGATREQIMDGAVSDFLVRKKQGTYIFGPLEEDSIPAAVDLSGVSVAMKDEESILHVNTLEEKRTIKPVVILGRRGFNLVRMDKSVFEAGKSGDFSSIGPTALGNLHSASGTVNINTLRAAKGITFVEATNFLTVSAETRVDLLKKGMDAFLFLSFFKGGPAAPLTDAELAP